MEYTLPKTVFVGGREYSIRSDYRAILDICEALTDPELLKQVSHPSEGYSFQIV